MKKVDPKSAATINREWDLLAPIRYNQIVTGADVTFNKVMLPAIRALLPARRVELIIDAGCGIGALTPMLAEFGTQVVGIDPSTKSIEIAKEKFGSYADFHIGTLEEFCQPNDSRADVVIANMVLMDVADLASFLAAVKCILAKNGVFIFSITHPWFWPEYYGYANKPWFRYHEELFVEAPFRISSALESEILSTHIHRPLSSYFDLLDSNSLRLNKLVEPMPSATVQSEYPVKWKYPRYLLGKCNLKRE